jgi:hypothetical protein
LGGDDSQKLRPLTALAETMFYRETICLLSHTGPILGYSGDEPFNGITAALPKSFIQGSPCLISVAERAQSPRVLRGLLDRTGT